MALNQSGITATGHHRGGYSVVYVTQHILVTMYLLFSVTSILFLFQQFLTGALNILIKKKKGEDKNKSNFFNWFLAPNSKSSHDYNCICK